MRKITVRIPTDLLANAQRATDKGLTKTIQMALERLVAARACADLRALRGKVRLSRDLPALRRD